MLKKFNLMIFFLFFFPLWSVFFVSNLFLFWLLMEIFNIFFIVYVSMKKIKKQFIMYFFIIQSIASLFFLMSFFFLDFNWMNYLAHWGLFLSLVMKMGLIPFHGWVIKMSNFLNFENLFVFLILMKIMPLFIMYYVFECGYFENVVILFNLFGCSLLMFHTNSLKKILILSSMAGTSMKIFLMFFSLKIFIFYFLLYYFFTMAVFYALDMSNVEMIFEGKLPHDLSLFIMIFSMSGLPLSLGFLMKWYLFSEIFFNSFFYAIIFFFVSVLSSFFYFKIIMLYFNFYSFSGTEIFFSKNMKIFLMFLFFFLLSTFFFMVL